MALDEALCFGWIDGQAKKYVKNHICKNLLREGKKVFGLREILKK